MRSRRGPGGFTLIEALVSVALMVVLVASLSMIFNSGIQTVKISEARMKIQASARAAMDHLWRDLSSMLPMDGGSQRFWMRDDAVDPVGGPMALTNPDRHVTGACDSLGFRTVTSVNGVLLPVQVIYRVVLDSDPLRRKTVARVVNGRIRNGRFLYVLRKELLDLNGRLVVDAATGQPVQPVDLCYYVTAFNLEYLYAMSDNPADARSKLNAQFCQIAPDKNNRGDGPFPGPNTGQLRTGVLAQIPATTRPLNPMGEPDGAGDGVSMIKNDIPAATESGRRFRPAFTVPAIRATLRVVEDVEARQERVYTRVIWMPTG